MRAKFVNESLNEDRVSSIGKTEKILQFIEDAGPEGKRYTDIIRFAYEMTHGEGSYTNDKRGYWSGGFKTPTPDARTFGHLMKYIIKKDDGKWILRDEEMTPDEMEFHGKRVTYGDSGYKPEKYKGPGWTNPRFDAQGSFRPRVNQRYYDAKKARGEDVSGLDIDTGEEEDFYDERQDD